MIRVLLADDQALVRTGFRMILSVQPDMTVVGEVANGAQAVDLTAELYDVAREIGVVMSFILGGSAARPLIHRG